MWLTSILFVIVYSLSLRFFLFFFFVLFFYLVAREDCLLITACPGLYVQLLIVFVCAYTGMMVVILKVITFKRMLMNRLETDLQHMAVFPMPSCTKLYLCFPSFPYVFFFRWYFVKVIPFYLTKAKRYSTSFSSSSTTSSTLPAAHVGALLTVRTFCLSVYIQSVPTLMC